MKTNTWLAITGVVTAAATSLFAGPATAATAHRTPKPAHSSAPVFVQNDNPAGNTVFVYDRDATGVLHAAGRYATGGVGGQLPDSVVDHLASQGALTYDRAQGLLYAVNAGSNTVTVFAVRGDRLLRLQVVSSGGTFPVSVAVHGSEVYVLNGLNGGAIQGYLSVAGFLVRIPAWNRSLGLSTAVPAGTPGFLNAPGQVAFTPDGSKLVVTTKANGSSIDVFPLGLLGDPARTPVVTKDLTNAAANVPFDVAFDRYGRLDVAEAGPNAVARYVVNRNGTLTLTGRVGTGQAATCWIVAAPRGGTLYVDNAGSGTITTTTVRGAGLADTATTSTDGGTTDATISSDAANLYVQTGAAGIVDEFAVGHDGALSKIGSITVPGAVGGEGIASA